MPRLDRITFDPKVMGGKPCLQGMRFTVGTIVGLIASGATPEEILADYRRPQYTREVLDALAKCDGIGDWMLLPNVEPGNAEVIAAFRDFHACECRLVVNERRLGLNRNTLDALMRAFHLKADHVIHLEDETIPSPDALRFFEWGIDHLAEHGPKHTILLVSGYNKPKTEPTPEQSHLCDTHPIWTPWGWGVDRRRLVWLMANWCTRNPKCFTCNFRSQYQRTRKELYPILSRMQNIGHELGENGRTAEWYRANHRTPWVATNVGSNDFGIRTQETS